MNGFTTQRFGPSDRRSKPRFRDPAARCNLGYVLDLSANGLRVRLAMGQRLAPGDMLSLRLDDMQVRTRVSWARRRFGRQTVGLTFETITPELRQTLSNIVLTTISVPVLAGVREPAA